jgi:hypothetical protein
LQTKTNLVNFYENIFLCLNQEILNEKINQNLNLESQNFNLQIKNFSSKILLNNFVNHLIMFFNIISERKLKSNFFERKKIIENIKNFFSQAKFYPIIFSQKAFDHSYELPNSSNLKILMEMIVDILLDVDVKMLKEIFYYYNYNKDKNKDNYIDNDLDNQRYKINNNFIDEKNKIKEINIGENLFKENINKNNRDNNKREKNQFNTKRSIFYYMDLIYKFKTSDFVDEKHKYFSELFEINKKYDKDLDSMSIQSKIFYFPSYTLFFLTKFVMIYIFYKEEKKNYENIYCKHNRVTFGENKKNKEECLIVQFYTNKLENLEYFIDILMIDLKIIITKYEKMLNFISLQNDRTKNLDQSMQINNTENNESTGNFIIINKSIFIFSY